ncbi:MAG: protein translocase subunit SecF [Clostridia bacterium]|nr:protein translocase subunit SecF [Clostridia bacterium]
MKGVSLDFTKSKFRFDEKYRLWLILPIVIILVTIAVIVGLGETLSGGYIDAVGIGIDFEGGSKVTVDLTAAKGTDVNYDEWAQKIETEVEKNHVGENYIHVSYVQKLENSNNGHVSVQIRYRNITADDEEMNQMNETVKAQIAELLGTDESVITYESVSSTAAKNLLSSAGLAVGISVALILIYIIIRFTFISGIAAIIALIHDVVIMFCLTVWCRNIPINTSYVAAMVTIVSYSINNTIVIFDRVRELMRPFKGMKNIDYNAIGDEAIKSTMRRSIFTTFTTLATVFFLAVLGGDSMQEFCVPIILGLVAGFYSSIFVATPLWATMSYSWEKTLEKIRIKRGIETENYVAGDASQVNSKAVGKKNNKVDAELGGDKPSSDEAKKAKAQKAKANTIYKYSKKNTQFKKKK